MPDPESYLAPVSAENPAGIALRDEIEFHVLLEALEPASHAARHLNGGDKAQPVTSIAWAEVLEQAEGLARTGRDLQLLTLLARIWTHTEGVAGAVDGLILLARAIEDHWDALHPELRGDDDEPMANRARRRAAALNNLVETERGLLGDLRMNPYLTAGERVPSLTGIEIFRAAHSDTEMLERYGRLADAERKTRLDEHHKLVARVDALVKGYAKDHPQVLSSCLEHTRAATAAVARLQASYDERHGPNGEVRLDPLQEFFAFAERMLVAASPAPAMQAGTDGQPAQATNGAAGPAPAAAPVGRAGIQSRDDVVRALTEIIDFYKRTEPSSPIPHLLERVRRVVPMSFLQIMEEVAPSGLKEFRNIAGMTEKDKT